MLNNLIHYEKGIFNTVLTYIFGDVNCLCSIYGKKNKGINLLLVDKHLSSYMRFYINKYFKSCAKIKGYIKNIIKTEGYIVCDDHKLTLHDVDQLNMTLESYYNGEFNPYIYQRIQQSIERNNVSYENMTSSSDSTYVDTRSFIHTDNMDNLVSFVNRHVDSNKLTLGHKCCSGKGIEVTIHPMYLDL